ECTNATHCAKRYGPERGVCVYATCQACLRDGDCFAWGSSCAEQSGTCDPYARQSDENCPPGWSCTADAGILDGLANSDCPPTEFCDAQHCRPRYPPPGL